MSYYQSTVGANQNVGYTAHPQPYGCVQQQPQPYSGYQNNSEYMTQVTPGYNPTAPPPSEYMRQPASYPHVPMIPMPEPARETIREQPQVIIVHHNNNDGDGYSCLGWCCRCICESVATLIWTAALIVAAIIVIGLIVYFVKFYRRHY